MKTMFAQGNWTKFQENIVANQNQYSKGDGQKELEKEGIINIMSV